MPKRNVVSWNAMISAYGRHGQFNQALRLFQQMLHQNQQIPNKKTIFSLLKALANPKALAQAKLMHVHIILEGLESHNDVAAALINMYGKCSSVVDAENVFESVLSRNVACWTAIISVNIENDKVKEALQLLSQMWQKGLEPTKAVFTKALEACASMRSLEDGKLIHVQIVESGLDSQASVGNALVSMYSRHGFLNEAQTVFDLLSEQDVCSWTVIIKAYAENGMAKGALQAFQKMLQKGVEPNAHTFSTIIEAFSNPSVLAEAKLIHSQVINYGLESNIVVATALINTFAKCGSIHDARNVFNNVNKKDVVLWTAMIGIYARGGNGEEAFDFLQQMEKEGMKPDKWTYSTVLSACASPADRAKGEVIHTSIRERGFESDIIVKTALINMYSKCGCLDVAWRMFNEVSQRDVVTWTVIIAAFALHGSHEDALRLFEQMLQEDVKPNKVTFVTILDSCSNYAALADGKRIHKEIVDSALESDITVGTALMNMYVKCGCLHDVERTFSRFSDLDVVLWNMMIEAYDQHGESKEAVQLYKQMCQQASIKPDRITFIHVLAACSHGGLVDEGRQTFESMKCNYGITPVGEHVVYMVDLLGKAGWLDEAELYISEMQSQRSAFVWMTLLNACKRHDDIDRAERAAERVLELDELNTEAYVILASIYAAAGRLDDAAKVKEKMGKL